MLHREADDPVVVVVGVAEVSKTVRIGVDLIRIGDTRAVVECVGVFVAVAGAGYIVFNLGAFVAPGVDLGWLFVTFLGELVFMVWLLYRGWRIPEPAPGT